ncbi:hypothetical protein MHYP_G00320680 [Metynnis hypsauchen]
MSASGTERQARRYGRGPRRTSRALRKGDGGPREPSPALLERGRGPPDPNDRRGVRTFGRRGTKAKRRGTGSDASHDQRRCNRTCDPSHKHTDCGRGAKLAKSNEARVPRTTTSVGRRADSAAQRACTKRNTVEEGEEGEEGEEEAQRDEEPKATSIGETTCQRSCPSRDCFMQIKQRDSGTPTPARKPVSDGAAREPSFVSPRKGQLWALCSVTMRPTHERHDSRTVVPSNVLDKLLPKG